MNIFDSLTVDLDAFFNDIDESDITISHFTSSEGLKSIIESKSLWFTDYRFLNDYNELDYGIKLFYHCVGKIESCSFKKNLSENLFKLRKRKLDYYFSDNEYGYKVESLESDLFVFSCSIDSDNINLWNYYTKNDLGLGYSFCFNPEKYVKDVIKNDLVNGMSIPYYHIYHGKVLYKEEEQISFIKKYLKRVKEKYKLSDEDKMNDIINETLSKCLLMCMFFKDIKFENELEYRIIIVLPKMYSLNDYNKYPYRLFTEKFGVYIPRLKMKLNTDLFKEIKASPYNKNSLWKLGLKEVLACHNVKEVKLLDSIIPIRFLKG